MSVVPTASGKNCVEKSAVISESNIAKKGHKLAYVLFKVTTRFELVIRELQSLALPLGYVTKTLICFAN